MSEDKFSNTNIVSSTEVRWFRHRPPVTLRQVGLNRIIGRTILEWEPFLGSYGMGGPGFAGFLLSKTRNFPREWLALILWGADNLLLLDGRWVNAHPRWYDEQNPWLGGGKAPWDDFTPIVIGSLIAEAKIIGDESLIYLERSDVGERHLLEVPRDMTLLSKFGGSGEQRQWYPAESHLDAWVISHKGILYC